MQLRGFEMIGGTLLPDAFRERARQVESIHRPEPARACRGWHRHRFCPSWPFREGRA